MNRTPDQIRNHAVKAFNQLAPTKYDIGQAKAEVTNNLDQHPDLIGALREELMDGWFYLESLREQMDKKDKQIAALEYEVQRWKDIAKR